MGFTINKKITTELTYEDVALIAVALGMYQDVIEDKKDKQFQHAVKLVNRLGEELWTVKH